MFYILEMKKGKLKAQRHYQKEKENSTSVYQGQTKWYHFFKEAFGNDIRHEFSAEMNFLLLIIHGIFYIWLNKIRTHYKWKSEHREPGYCEWIEYKKCFCP